MIKPPNIGPDKPDEDTAKAPDYSGPEAAPNRVFYFHACGIRYGTDDKSHAAAILLSSGLLIVLLILFIIGSFVDREWIPDALKIIGTSFTFTAGVAIGQSTSQNHKKNKDD